MPNGTKSQERVKILVFFDGKLKLGDHEFLKNYTETMFNANKKMNSLNRYFLYFKKITKPLHEDVIDFYKYIFIKIDADFEGISSDKIFIEIVQGCECFADFVQLRPDSFKRKLLEYLFDLKR